MKFFQTKNTFEDTNRELLRILLEENKVLSRDNLNETEKIALEKKTIEKFN